MALNEAGSNIADEVLDLIPDRCVFEIAYFECRVSNYSKMFLYSVIAPQHLRSKIHLLPQNALKRLALSTTNYRATPGKDPDAIEMSAPINRNNGTVCQTTVASPRC